jgi:hypothetical protein
MAWCSVKKEQVKLYIHPIIMFSLLSKNLNIIYDYKFTCCSVWVSKLVSDTKWRTHIEVLWEQGAEENIWTWRQEVAGGWRRLHNEELHNFTLHSVITVKETKGMWWEGYAARMDEMKCVCKTEVGKYEGKRPSGRPRRRWEDNIWLGLREKACQVVDWIHLARDREQWRAVVNTLMNLSNILCNWKLIKPVSKFWSHAP